MEAQAIRDEKPFAAAEEKFHELVERLSSTEVQGLAHGELESLIAAEPDVETCLQRATVLGRAPSHTPVDATLVNLGEPAGAHYPLERLLGRGNGFPVARLHAQVDE